MNIVLSNLQKPIMWATAVIVTIAAAISWPEKAQETLWFVLESFVGVAPTIATGLALSAWVAASGAGVVTAKWFQGRPASRS